MLSIYYFFCHQISTQFALENTNEKEKKGPYRKCLEIHCPGLCLSKSNLKGYSQKGQCKAKWIKLPEQEQLVGYQSIP